MSVRSNSKVNGHPPNALRMQTRSANRREDDSMEEITKRTRQEDAQKDEDSHTASRSTNTRKTHQDKGTPSTSSSSVSQDENHVSQDEPRTSNSKPKRKSAKKEEPACKKFRLQSSARVTTRSETARRKLVHFVSEPDCDCNPNIEHEYFTLHGKRIKTCKRDIILQRYCELASSMEYKDLEDIQPDIDCDRNDNQLANISSLSTEILCYILDYLSVKEILCLESMSRKFREIVHLSLSLRHHVDFLENVTGRQAFENNLKTLTDFAFNCLLAKLPNVKKIYNFHPEHISCRHSRGNKKLTIQGVTAALRKCKSLEGIQISNMQLLESLLTSLPHVRILGRFQNREQHFPPDVLTSVSLPEESHVTSLHLVGCCVNNLPTMDSHLKHLYLRMVRFAHPHPFKDFSACKLETFVMAHCAGPPSALKYIPLLTSLAEAPRLKRLELQRVPFLGGVIQHICEDSWRDGGFRRLRHIAMGACKNALDADLGFLIIAAAGSLETLYVQPSLSCDAVFAALNVSEIQMYPGFEQLSLGWVDSFPDKDEWSNEELVAEGLAAVTETQARMTDVGMKLVGQCFPTLGKLELYNCPHLLNPVAWLSTGMPYFTMLRELTLRNCYSILVDKFYVFLQYLPLLESLTLEEMFREKPKGCSRVGLTAGTGLGVAMALVSTSNNQGVQGHYQAPGFHDNNDADNQLGAGNHDNNGENMNGDSDDREESETENSDDENDAGDEVEGHRRSNGNHGYSLRRSHNANEQRIDRPSCSYNTRSRENGQRKSPRLVKRSRLLEGQTHQVAGGSKRASDKENGAKHSKRSPKSKCDNSTLSDDPDSSLEDNSGRDFKRSSGSCDLTRSNGKSGSGRGKAIVSKKGLIYRTKSSARKKDSADGQKLAGNDGSERLTSTGDKEGPECTCVTPTQDACCQATLEDIRNTNLKLKEKKKKKKRKKRKKKQQLDVDVDGDKIITPGRFVSDGPGVRGPAPPCKAHGRRHPFKPGMRDQSNSTSDPVMEDDHPMMLILTHPRLEYVFVTGVGAKYISINCPLLKTLSVSQCRVLKKVNLVRAPLLEYVHVSQCRKFDEDHLMDHIYRLEPHTSKFVSLRPMHELNEHKFYNNIMFTDNDYKYGTAMTFDYSPVPSETLYNKVRMKSWVNMLEQLSQRTMSDYGWPRFLDMESPNKSLSVLNGTSVNDSEWLLLTDIPWISLLQDCQLIDSQYIKNPNHLKDGLYCMESRGHFSVWDAYVDVQDYIEYLGPDQGGLYDYNVLTYVNMCDTSGVPAKDSKPVM